MLDLWQKKLFLFPLMLSTHTRKKLCFDQVQCVVGVGMQKCVRFKNNNHDQNMIGKQKQFKFSFKMIPYYRV